MEQILETLVSTRILSPEDAVLFLEGLDSRPDIEESLYQAAHRTRLATYGTDVYLRGLIEFSNYCTANCNYCGLRAEQDIERYRLTEEEILAQAGAAYDYGYRTFVLQSGEDPWYTRERVVSIVRGIKERAPEAAVTLSIGEKSREDFLAFREAGADRYLLRHEAYSKTLYDSLHPDMSYEHRIGNLRELKGLGFQTGAGFMVGVKGQTTEDLAQDLAFLQDLQPDMVGIGPFLPAGGTPYAQEPAGSVKTTLRLLAVTRLLLPHVLLPLTTALVSLDPEVRATGFHVGANVLMPNITPGAGGLKYKLYENKRFVEGLHPQRMAELEAKIEAAGYTMSMERGDVRR
ncbi:[FeFe] hydrogenase H-cluster radical SAM maturase HydE [Clostridiales bacterium F-3ap]|uniref:[FeFe] hydrogenase H-cluster radical SAM maturase HydE n=2 Tax=Anaerotalea alkaliphila TaxID=2662126 RepID=A0A7X5HY55_9FIRM|nr:[FeFe] hydrogenase H-cluster radical SAM maturase HydE [Anaerotalea alkaliphila]